MKTAFKLSDQGNNKVELSYVNLITSTFDIRDFLLLTNAETDADQMSLNNLTTVKLGQKNLFKSLFSPNEQETLIGKHQIDKIVSFNPHTEAKFKQIYNIAIFTRLKSNDGSYFLGSKQIKNSKLFKILSSFDKIIVSSQMLLERMSMEFNLENKLIALQTNPDFQIDCDKNHISKIQLFDRYMLFEGPINENSNIKSILNAIVEIRDFRLVIAGEKNQHWSELQNYAASFPELDQRVVFVENPSAISLDIMYRNADIFVYPCGEYEYPIEIQKATTSKCMVLCSDFDSFYELGGPYSWYVSPNNSSELRIAMVELWNSPESRREISERSFNYSQKFSKEQLMAKLKQSNLF